jgi:hypothetical protein
MPSRSSVGTLRLQVIKTWVEVIAVPTLRFPTLRFPTPSAPTLQFPILQFPILRFPTPQPAPQKVPGRPEMRVAVHGDKEIPELIEQVKPVVGATRTNYRLFVTGEVAPHCAASA